MDSHPSAAHVVTPDQLCVGLHIHLDLPWINHPFPFPSFKINSPEQIATIRRLGLKEIRYSPAKSDCPPLTTPPSDEPAATPEAAEPQRRCTEETVADQAKQARIKRLAEQHEKIAACEREYLNTTRQMKAVRQNLFSRPGEVGEQASEAVAKLADSMLVDGGLSIHLMSDKVAGNDVFNHELNVCLLSMMVGRELALPADEIRQLGVGALLHDIGQADIPGHIKNKTTPLTRPEAALLRQHCALGVTLGKTLGLPAEALLIIAQHHEHIDGSGYPQGLPEAQLPLPSRIVAVVENYEELCNPRHAEKAYTPHEALSMMYSEQRRQLDESVVNAFIRCLGVYPPGTLVLLSNGMLGVVTTVNSAHLLKPTVMVYDATLAHGETILVDLDIDSDVAVSKTVRPQQLPPEVGQFFAARKRVAYYFSSEPAEY